MKVCSGNWKTAVSLINVSVVGSRAQVFQIMEKRQGKVLGVRYNLIPASISSALKKVFADRRARLLFESFCSAQRKQVVIRRET